MVADTPLAWLLGHIDISATGTEPSAQTLLTAPVGQNGFSTV